MRIATTYLAQALMEDRHREARDLRHRRIYRELRAERKRAAKAAARAVQPVVGERPAAAEAKADVVIDLRDEVVARPRVKELARD